jgi:hypothetical protein
MQTSFKSHPSYYHSNWHCEDYHNALYSCKALITPHVKELARGNFWDWKGQIAVLTDKEFDSFQEFGDVSHDFWIAVKNLTCLGCFRESGNEIHRTAIFYDVRDLIIREGIDHASWKRRAYPGLKE